MYEAECDCCEQHRPLTAYPDCSLCDECIAMLREMVDGSPMEGAV